MTPTSAVHRQGGQRGGGRLVLDTFSLTAYSTRADVFEAVARAKAKGLTPREAIAAVAATRVAPERGF